MMHGLVDEAIEKMVREALAEDVGAGDATTLSVVDADLWVEARMVAREQLVVAGLPLMGAVFRALSDSIELELRVKDGSRCETGEILATLVGPAQPILTGERTALNFVQRLSGIATLTAAFVDALRGTEAKLLDTRKTSPGWRRLEKYAVRCGGGHNHRAGLFDQILIKDNHLLCLREGGADPLGMAVRRAREQYPGLMVEVEVDSPAQLQSALAAGVDRVLLDNMSLEQLREAVALAGRRVETEASGGIGLSGAAAVAATGVDYVSTGAITHSARAVDIALDFMPRSSTGRLTPQEAGPKGS